MQDKPSWWPRIIDTAHIARLREDYPEANMTDEGLLDYFEEGKRLGQFSTRWDHVGEAYDDYEKLARAFLQVVQETGKKPGDFDD